MKLLNLGCGDRYHTDWINLDFISHNKEVLAHNLLQGIPFPDNSMDVVYHSHVLEHFSKADGETFIEECYRVLKPGGIIRIAIPNLEVIVDNYKKYLELSLQGDQEAEYNYDWVMLELYDQAVRTSGGGQMGKFLVQDTIPNEDFVQSRIGHFYNVVRGQRTTVVPITYSGKVKTFLKQFSFVRGAQQWMNTVKKKYFNNYFVGKFRLSGEVHQWMYDRFSLSRLLGKKGFQQQCVQSAVSSYIPQWVTYHLDTEENGNVYKPDSLFIEAIK